NLGGFRSYENSRLRKPRASFRAEMRLSRREKCAALASWPARLVRATRISAIACRSCDGLCEGFGGDAPRALNKPDHKAARRSQRRRQPGRRRQFDRDDPPRVSALPSGRRRDAAQWTKSLRSFAAANPARLRI